MDERKAFTERLQDMLEQARIGGNQISQQEIQDFFADLKLSGEQMNHIYSYLAAHRITVRGFVPEEDGAEPDSAFLKMYLRELRGVEKLTKTQELELAERIVELACRDAGHPQLAELKERFIHHKLRYVVSRARKYALGGETLDELVQEGNIGLMLAMQELNAGEKAWRLAMNNARQEARQEVRQAAEHFLACVEEQIVQAMERYINENYAAGSEEQAMVAKVNFVSEAAKALKEENGQEPTLAEMAAYTNLTEEELLAIINLSADNLKA